MVPTQSQSDWNDKLLQLPHSVRVFHAITLADEVEASTDDTKLESKFLTDANRFKTPSKKRKKAGFSENEELGMKREVVAFEAHKRELPEEGDPGLDVIIADGFDQNCCSSGIKHDRIGKGHG